MNRIPMNSIVISNTWN